jgi:hydroxysqualene dehydroxylase
MACGDAMTKITKKSARIAVVGAGWAGCAAAVELAQAGYQVDLFEAARTLGGRARQVVIEGKTLDNGQHILLGAYTQTQRLLSLCGVDLKQAFLRLPLQMCYPTPGDGMTFCAARLPAPLHLLVALLRAKGLQRPDKLALSRFATSARWMDWQLDIDCSVIDLLQRFDQTERLYRLMWRPLCIAALNTPPERASAQVFLRVLKDSLGSKRSTSDMLLPKQDLSTLLPLPATRFLKEHGGKLHLGTSIKQILRHEPVWQLHDSNQTMHEFQGLIIATSSQVAAQLLANHLPAADDFATRFTHNLALPQEAITTCYLQYDASIRLKRPMFALLDDPSAQQFGQFVFDRGQLQYEQAGLLAVVVSAAAKALTLPQAELAQAVAEQLAKAFQLPLLQKPLWHKIISEKRATFACTPGLLRPSQATGQANLFLAGDYTSGPYPATLEGAVCSGIQAAHLLANKLSDRPSDKLSDKAT